MSDNDVDSTPADEGSSESAATPGKAAASSGTGAGADKPAFGGAGGSAETVKTRTSESSDAAVVAEAAEAVGAEKTVTMAKSEGTDATVKTAESEADTDTDTAKVDKPAKTPGSARATKSGTTAATAGAVTAAASSADGPSPALSRGKLVAVGSIGAIALGAAVGAAGYFFVQNSQNEALLAAHEEARQAACDYAPRLADYDAKNLDAYFAAVLDGATGDWHEQFDDTSRELREVLTEGQVVSKVQHVECAIKTGDETSAEAVIMIGQTITSVGTQGQASPGQLSMVLRMEKTDGRWLVNQVDSPLPAPQQ